MTSITLRMDDELAHDIHRLTKSLKKPKSEVIRECVRAFIKTMKQAPAQSIYEQYLALYDEIPAIEAPQAPSHKVKMLGYLRKKKAEGRL